jgi:ABC-type uncharacterized transport system permease subunit
MTTAATITAISFYLLGIRSQLLGLRKKQFPLNRLGFSLIAVGLVAHGFATFFILDGTQGVNLSLLSVTNFGSYLVIVFISLISLRLPVTALSFIATPIAIIILLFGTFLPQESAKQISTESPLLFHIFASLAAYVALFMATVQSVLLGVQESKLKSHSGSLGYLVPSLETMDRLLIAMLWWGLGLLSISILTGFFFLEDIMAQRVAHHVVITTLSWAAYVVFFIGRIAFNWRGTLAVRWTLVAFSLLVLGYAGSKFVVEYMLSI